MLLKKIFLHNFRNFVEKEFNFSPFLTIIYGDNALGKTNLLEAIYCLTHGVGFRESKEDELVKIGNTQAKVRGVFLDNKRASEFQIVFDNSKPFLEKKYLIGKTSKKFFYYQSEITGTVLFSPQQLEILTGSPEGRRQYFDRLIGGYEAEYKKKLTNYENALRKRNKILEAYQSEKQLEEDLFFWDDYLEEQANYLTKKREEYINYLNRHKKIDDKAFSIHYLANRLTKARLSEFFLREKKYRKTLIGPQKDDFQIEVIEKEERKNLHLYGSRSEHRLGIFWLKMNEIRYYEEKIGKKPIVLLDDIFSELDVKNKKLILDLIKKYQTILTTAEPEIFNLVKIPNKTITL